MSVTPRVWLVTFMALVFMIGLSAGVLVDRTLLAPPDAGRSGGGRGGDGPGPIGLYGPLGPPPERFVADLERRLDLTADQRDAILAVLDEHQPRIRELQETARTQFVTEQQALFDAIASHLTPDQITTFQEITSRQRDRGGDRRGGRDGGGRRGGGRNGGGS